MSVTTVRTAPRTRPELGTDLLEKAPWLKRLVRSRSFQFLLVLPNLLVFYVLLLAGVVGHPLGSVNAAVVMIWILWWFVLIALLVPLGARAWCAMCPLPAAGEWLQRRSIVRFRGFEKPRGANRQWPGRLRNIWLQNFGFLGLAAISGLLVTRPLVTVVVVGGIGVLATVLMLRYRRRAFCVYLCPVSGFQGLYSMVAPLALRPKDTDVCDTHKPVKGCIVGSRRGDTGALGYPCPWFQSTFHLDRNNYCGLCMECVKSCQKDNLGLFWRGGRMDVALRGRDEAWKAFIMTALAAVYAVVLLGPYGRLKDFANVTFSGDWGGFLLQSAALILTAAVVLPALYTPFAALSRRLGREAGFWEVFVRGAFGLVPLSLAAWIAFSIPLVLVNWAYVAQVLSDPFGWGWNLLGTKYLAWRPVGSGWIPTLQAGLVVAGLAVGIVKTRRAVEPLFTSHRAAGLALIPLAGFLTLVGVGYLALFTG
jgi:polyferredoxin